MNKTIYRKCIPMFILFAVFLLQAGCADTTDPLAQLDAPETYNTHTDEVSSAYPQSDDMSVQYPNAYKVFSEIYGAYFYVDQGAFCLQWENSTAVIRLEPIEIEDVYEETDLTAEVEP